MSYIKQELLTLPLEEREALASNLIDSILIDESHTFEEGKQEIINERIKYHNDNHGNGMEWSEQKKKYGR